jgi:ATP-dependent RNA helicase SUPV3L1/SUV3
MMIEAGPSDREKDLLSAPVEFRHNFSIVQGFQVVGADHHVAGQNISVDEAWRDALKLELETRAARFHHAVDAAIVLSNDGAIRWVGDPVARLSLGPNILTPKAVILADESLPAASHDIAKTRIELWLAAMTRRVLGPLFALEALQEGSEVVRDLAGRLARSLGILEREPIRGKIKALAQDERAELRKHGVRFGAYYIFLPTLIKPAARALALQLWRLQASGDADVLVPALAQVASSGRTSLPLDRWISREGYRIAGYRPCGERIVRVDVLERLAGMIRAAIVERHAPAAFGPAGRGTSSGFVVGGQMTSLTGCAGEQFASILRSMGFRSVEMKRSEFIGSPSAAESSQKRKPVSLTETSELAEDDRPSPAARGEEGTPIDSPQAAPPEAPSADGARLVVGAPDMPGDRLCSDAYGAASAAPPASATSPKQKENAEMIVVWRPNRSAHTRLGTSESVRRNCDEASKREHSRIGPLGRPDRAGHTPASAAGRTRNKSERPSTQPSPDACKGAAPTPGNVDRRDAVRSDEKHRQTPRDRDMPRSRLASERQPKGKIDRNSPFAKLLELKSLLEGQANKRP